METEENQNENNFIPNVFKFVVSIVVLIGLYFWRSSNKENIMKEYKDKYDAEERQDSLRGEIRMKREADSVKASINLPTP